MFLCVLHTVKVGHRNHLKIRMNWMIDACRKRRDEINELLFFFFQFFTAFGRRLDQQINIYSDFKYFFFWPFFFQIKIFQHEARSSERTRARWWQRQQSFRRTEALPKHRWYTACVDSKSRKLFRCLPHVILNSGF